MSTNLKHFGCSRVPVVYGFWLFSKQAAPLVLALLASWKRLRRVGRGIVTMNSAVLWVNTWENTDALYDVERRFARQHGTRAERRASTADECKSNVEMYYMSSSERFGRAWSCVVAV